MFCYCTINLSVCKGMAFSAHTQGYCAKMYTRKAKLCKKMYYLLPFCFGLHEISLSLHRKSRAIET